MAEALPRYCPRCGTPTREDMQFCATCELPVEAMLHRPDNPAYTSNEFHNAAPQEAAVPTSRHTQQGDETYFAAQTRRSQDFQPDWGLSEEPTRGLPSSPVSPLPGGNTPGEPGAQPSWSAQPNQWPGTAQGSWQTADQGNPAPYSPAPQAPLWNTQAPASPSAAPQPRRKARAGRVFLILLLLLVLVGGGVFAYSMLGGHVPGLNASQATIKTTKLNSTLTYAGATVTLLNVQQAQNFVDDPHTASDGMLRLNLQEQNTTSVPISWDYTQSARLLIPGKPALAPAYVKSKGNIAPGATQQSVIDFAIANGGNLSTLSLQLGTSQEAQMQIPLNGQANLNQYQPKSTKQNGTLTYFGLNWTLTGSTTSWSIPGQQASNGMEFLTLDFSIDNPLSQEAISGSPFDYMRVKVDGKTVAPLSTTIPVSFNTGVTGKEGNALFLIPQNNTTGTLLMISQDSDASVQAKLDFPIS